MIELKTKIFQEDIFTYDAPKIELQELEMEQTTIRNTILQITKTNKQLLKNDLLLYLAYIKATKEATIEDDGRNLILTIPKTSIPSITKPSSICRTRRELYLAGEIEYDEETEIRRDRKRKLMREYYS